MIARANLSTWAGAAFCLLLSAVQVAGLNPEQLMGQYHQKIWTEREGLPHSCVQAIAQTPDGYLWVGTRDGLARFDGVNFKVFNTENEPALGSSDIRSLLVDHEGKLWVGTFNGGLSCYSHGHFLLANTKVLPGSGVIDLFEDSGHRLWLGTWNGLVCKVGDQLKTFQGADGLTGKRVWSVTQDSRGVLWVATSRGLHSSEPGEAVRFRLVNGTERAPLRTVHVDREDSVWTCSIGDGLRCRKDGVWRRYGKPEGLADERVNTMVEDRNGSMWVGTWGGLTRINRGLISSFKRADGLPHECIECLFEDHEGSLWIGTRGGGLMQLEDANFTAFNSRHGLASDLTKCVLQTSDGTIWIGTEGAGVSSYRDGTFKTYSVKEGLPSNFIYALAEGREGDLWLGSAHPAALIHWQNGRFTSFGRREGMPVEHQMRAIHVDPDGGVWCGGEEGGLSYYHEGKFKNFTAADTLKQDLIRVIFRDRTGVLWLGCGNGLCWFRNGSFEPCPGQDQMSNPAVYCAYQEPGGAIWFGTQRGLTRYKEGKFQSFASSEGLKREVICEVFQDQTGTLWFSSNRGIFSVSKKALADFENRKTQRLLVVPYGVADGMKSTHCEGGSQPAGCKDTAGRLWFTTAAGVVMIDPSQIKRKADPGPVKIEEIIAGTQSVALEGEAPRFGPSVRQMQFTYTVMSLTAPDRVQFRYRLKGYDRDWLEAQTRRVARYTELPPREYVFEVVARVPGGEWQKIGAAFAFALAPHFYETSWFLLVCASVVGLIAWLAHRWKMRQVQTGFALVLEERNRIARELHDTLAQGFAGTAFQLQVVAANIERAPTEAKKHLELAVNMVRHSLVEARRSVMNIRSLDLEKTGLADALARSARQMAAGRGVRVELEQDGEPQPLASEVENELLRIGQEAISNAVKHANAQKLRMSVKFNLNRVQLQIEDDGKGFTPATPLQAGGTHFGLRGMQERTGRIRGQLDIRSCPGKGTCVSVEVPLVPTLASS